MADEKKKKLTPEAQTYQAFQQQREPKRPVFKNCLKAFFVGGFICLIGQVISTFYIYFFDFTEKTVGNPTVATLIFITMLLTGFGVYDRLDRKSTRLNSSHVALSYAVFCLKKKE